MSLNRLSPNSDLSTDGGRGQLNETLELMAAEIRRLKREAQVWNQWAARSAEIFASGGAGSPQGSPGGILSALGGVGAWQDATFTGTWVTNCTYLGRILPIGPVLLCQVQINVSGSVGTPGNLEINPPTDYAIDESRLPTPHGFGVMSDAGVIRDLYVGWAATPRGVVIRYKNATGTITNLTHTAPVTPASGDNYTFLYILPVVKAGDPNAPAPGGGGTVYNPPAPTAPTQTNPWRHGIPRYSTGPL